MNCNTQNAKLGTITEKTLVVGIDIGSETHYVDLEQALDRLMSEGLRMPGAMCGLWGICGAITSIGAALAIIDGTGPLSTDETWGNHMQFTSKAIGELGAINGPRCCKRDAMIAFKNGVTVQSQPPKCYAFRRCGVSAK